MTGTRVKILDKEDVSKMSYVGTFNRRFVHFHFYITHEAACESLQTWIFLVNTERHVAMHGHSTLPSFSVVCNLFTALICILHVFSSFYWTPPPAQNWYITHFYF